MYTRAVTIILFFALPAASYGQGETVDVPFPPPNATKESAPPSNSQNLVAKPLPQVCRGYPASVQDVSPDDRLGSFIGYYASNNTPGTPFQMPPIPINTIPVNVSRCCWCDSMCYSDATGTRVHYGTERILNIGLFPQDPNSQEGIKRSCDQHNTTGTNGGYIDLGVDPPGSSTNTSGSPAKIWRKVASCQPVWVLGSSCSGQEVIGWRGPFSAPAQPFVRKIYENSTLVVPQDPALFTTTSTITPNGPSYATPRSPEHKAGTGTPIYNRCYGPVLKLDSEGKAKDPSDYAGILDLNSFDSTK